MTQDERPARRVLMRCEGVGFGRWCRCRCGCWQGSKRVACRIVSRDVRWVTVGTTDTPEDVSELVCNNDCIARTRKPNLGRLLRELSVCLTQSRVENS